MIRIPAPALLLGIAGLAPFLLAALVALGMVTPARGAYSILGFELFNVSDGRLLMARYGVIILSFMSGALWGFATRASGAQAAVAYTLAVIPALWAFLNPGVGADEVLINLGVGFAALLAIDFAFQRWGLAPPWWMSLRVPLTAVVLACLAIGVWT